MHKTTLLEKGIFLLEEMDFKEHANCYLVIGKEKAALIDTGTGLIDFAKVLPPLVGKRNVMPFLTHAHFDHTGGAHQFPRVLMHPSPTADPGWKYLKDDDFDEEGKATLVRNGFILPKIIPVHDNEVFDLGALSLQVIFTPGHSRDSISILIPEKKILFSGDTLYPGKLLWDFEDADQEAYLASLGRILSLSLKVIYGGHNAPLLDVKKAVMSAKKDVLSALYLHLCT